MLELPEKISTGVGLPIWIGELTIPVAAVCLVVALLSLRRALAPLGPLVRAAAAVATMALALSLALGLLIAAIVQGH